MKVTALEHDASLRLANYEEEVARLRHQKGTERSKAEELELKLACLISDKETEQRRYDEERARHLSAVEQLRLIERNESSMRERLYLANKSVEELRAARVAEQVPIRDDDDPRVALHKQIGELQNDRDRLQADANLLREDLAASKELIREKDNQIHDLDHRNRAQRALSFHGGPCQICPGLKKQIIELQEAIEAIQSEVSEKEIEISKLSAQLACAPPGLQPPDEGDFITKAAHEASMFALSQRVGDASKETFDHMKAQFQDALDEEKDENVFLVAENNRLKLDHQAAETQVIEAQGIIRSLQAELKVSRGSAPRVDPSPTPKPRSASVSCPRVASPAPKGRSKSLDSKSHFGSVAENKASFADRLVAEFRTSLGNYHLPAAAARNSPKRTERARGRS